MATDPKGSSNGVQVNGVSADQQEPDAAAPAGELAQAIQRLHADVKGRQRQVAQFALENLHELAFLPASSVAKRAGVHSATVVRFAQRLGFDGYPAMQQHIRHQLPQYPAFLELMGGADTASPILDQCFAQGRRNLEQASRTVDPTAFDSTVAALIRCRRVLVVGLGVARPVALYLESSLRITGLDVHDAADSVSLAQEIGLLGADDVMFAIDFHRYYRETAAATRAAREIGVTVVALTDSAVSPLAEHAHHTLHVPSEGAAPRTSLVPAMALLEGLLATITVLARDRAESAMDLVDRQYRAARLFVGG
jgi:DNA-binding MurR/RpiR family transcriptional regulator